MQDEYMIGRLAEDHDWAMARLGLGASPYDPDDETECSHWDEWMIDNAIDRYREDRADEQP